MAVAAVPVERVAEQRRTARRERVLLLARSPTFIAGAVMVGTWIVCAIGGSHLTPYDPFATDPLNRLRPPSAQHLFGTDQLGRDVLSRVVSGARGILIVAPLATLLGTAAGTAPGKAVSEACLARGRARRSRRV